MTRKNEHDTTTSGAVVTLANTHLAVVLLPRRGGKVADVTHRPSGHHLLQPPPRFSRGCDPAAAFTDWTPWAAPPPPGSPFDHRQAWGWDEMFPAVNAERYVDENGHAIDVPDHGEVWSRPWIVHRRGPTSVTLQVEGSTVPYRLTRQTELVGHTVIHRYHLENRGTIPIPWMWAAHPLITVEAPASLVVPSRWDRVRNAFSSPAMPDVGAVHRYPHPGAASRDAIRLDHIPGPAAGVARKWFFEHRPVGLKSTAGASQEERVEGVDLVLSHPALRLAFRGTADVVRWYGIWVNAGGMFGHGNTAIEGASAPMDTLSAAARLDRLPVLPTGGEVRWWFAMTVEM